jgi:hypothetical protein
MDAARYGDLINFYDMLDKPEKNIGGARKLADRSGRDLAKERRLFLSRIRGTKI